MMTSLIVLFGLSILALIWFLDARQWRLAGASGAAAACLLAWLVVVIFQFDERPHTDGSPVEHFEQFKRSMQAGDESAALAQLNKALRLQPSMHEAVLARAWIHHRRGNHEAAVEDFTAVIQRAPPSVLDRHGNAIYSARSQSYERLGRAKEARQDQMKSWYYPQDGN